jgi:hypothetical protein
MLNIIYINKYMYFSIIFINDKEITGETLREGDLF